MSFDPIVEFHPVMDYKTHSSFFFAGKKTQHQKSVRERLGKAYGVYAFYNSEAEVIYIGKAERQPLLKRMGQSLEKVRTGYKRYYVEHRERGPEYRKIVRKSLALWQVAEFFSAYEVDSKLIGTFEQFVIRLIPNDLVNARIEGNGKGKTSSKRKKSGVKSNG